jgi:ferredoxin
MNIITERCGYCGACVSVCPKNILELKEDRVYLQEGCEKCGSCVKVCPLGALEVGSKMERRTK